MNRFCPQLWDGVYINRAGNVYPCCHQNPVCLGNIRESRLADLVNGGFALEARRRSLNGTLDCYPSCTLLDKASIRRSGDETPSVAYGRMRRLHVSFGEACNIRCAMCSHPLRHARNPIVLDASIVIRNVEITPFEEIVLQGGEPLYVPACSEYMSYLESVGKRYTLLTNGLLIDDATAERLARHAKIVSISINGATKVTHERVNRGSDFERVLSSIETLRKARSRLGTDMMISGRMTLTPQNVHEIPQFLRTFRDLGIDRVNFGFVRETVPPFLAVKRELAAQLRREVSATLIESGGEDVDVLRLHQLGLLDGAVTPYRPALVPPQSEPDVPQQVLLAEL